MAADTPSAASPATSPATSPVRPSATSSGAHSDDHLATLRRADPLAALRALTIVGGKGGVGKTTVSCALALAAADAARDGADSPAVRVLLVSTDPAPSIADALGQPVGDEETPVRGAPGLVARQMDATAAFARLRDEYQARIDALFDALLSRGLDVAHDRGILRELLALAPPGIDELYAMAMLGETLAEARFALVVVDPAPTGHLLRLLEMPALALDWSHRLMRLMLKYRDVAGLGDAAAEVLAFARRTRALDALLHDPARAAAIVVALDEPLVRTESERLASAIANLGVSVTAVVWNRWEGDAARLPAPLSAPGVVAQLVAPATRRPLVGPSALHEWTTRWAPLRSLPSAASRPTA